jgi:dimethylamine/trimethylamine dehydrogenase
VALAEAGTEVGGRVTLESRLPGLSAWARVRDYRMGQIGKMTNVEVYRDSHLTAEDVLDFGAQHVCRHWGHLAARWRGAVSPAACSRCRWCAGADAGRHHGRC